MINQFRLQNFKSWRDTGEMRFAPLTAFFGANSSGKTAILQFLVVLKQTVESSDRNRVLHLGGDKSYVDLGTFFDVVHKHYKPSIIMFSLKWIPSEIRQVLFMNRKKYGRDKKINFEEINIDVTIKVDLRTVFLAKLNYSGFNGNLLVQRDISNDPNYEILAKINNYKKKIILGDIEPVAISKCYGVLKKLYHDEKFFVFGLDDIELEFETLFQKTYYLGPLREYPKRLYIWSGEKPQDVGTRGEWTVAALLASPVEMQQQVASWLKKLGLVYEFNLRVIAEGRREYEVMVKLTPESTEVPLTDVGFGVSQILPVLVLCYYVPEQSIVILEQPEIHLHPAIQANLADLLLEVIKTRRLQIILESHSEHLLRRLQRRLAEEVVSPDEVALYFTSLTGSESQLEPLILDEYGNIHNWPENFFGDEFGDLAAMTEAAIMRQNQPHNGTPDAPHH